MRSSRTAVLLPASKVCDLRADGPLLTEEAATLARFPDLLQGQHLIRLWEYGMALHTIGSWYQDAASAYLEGREPQATQGTGRAPRILDVGGAGSHFWLALATVGSEDVTIVDPGLPAADEGPGQFQHYPGTVEQYAATQPHGQFDVITAVSVVEHVETVRPFLRACHMLLRAGGLLFLTMDYWDAEGDDRAHFHWMRKRIYNVERVRKLTNDLREFGFKSYGAADWRYHGPQVYDYSVASLAMVKK